MIVRLWIVGVFYLWERYRRGQTCACVKEFICGRNHTLTSCDHLNILLQYVIEVSWNANGLYKNKGWMFHLVDFRKTIPKIFLNSNLDRLWQHAVSNADKKIYFHIITENLHRQYVTPFGDFKTTGCIIQCILFVIATLLGLHLPKLLNHVLENTVWAKSRSHSGSKKK